MISPSDARAVCLSSESWGHRGQTPSDLVSFDDTPSETVSVSTHRNVYM